MSKFKVGDKVVVDTTNTVFMERVLSGLGSRKYYTVTRTSGGGYWLQLDGMQCYGDPVPWCSEYFELYQEPDDELPPAPSSVSYLKENGRRKLVANICGGSVVNVMLSLGCCEKTKVLGYSLEPDAALQLAHDLRRMAMEIRRKEKASEV